MVLPICCNYQKQSQIYKFTDNSNINICEYHNLHFEKYLLSDLQGSYFKSYVTV
jgi:hypothetical protein